MILIALGSNIAGPWGSPREAVLRALVDLETHNIHVLKLSTLIETSPFGVIDQPNFVNAVAEIKTKHAPERLMQILHEIENRAGRKRTKKWGPRTLDLDLLDYNGLIINSELTLPHPGISERDFVLGPISEIAPDWTHPITGKTAALTLRELNSLNGN